MVQAPAPAQAQVQVLTRARANPEYRLSRAQCQWLEAADRAYASAIQQHDASIFAPYGTPEAIRRVYDYCSASPEIQFGLERYRQREWTVLGCVDGIMRVRRLLTHKDVKVHHNVFIALGDSLDEVWTVNMGCMKIERIEGRLV